jgi:hypothetical protein
LPLKRFSVFTAFNLDADFRARDWLADRVADRDLQLCLLADKPGLGVGQLEQECFLFAFFIWRLR